MNHAAAFNSAARSRLRAREAVAARQAKRKPSSHASSTTAVARVLGVPPTQWHNWIAGRQSPSTARLVLWLRTWKAAGMDPLVIVTTHDGASADGL